MILEEGKYYSKLWFISFPPSFNPTFTDNSGKKRRAEGGDATILVYRDQEDEDAHDTRWTSMLRLRYYAGPGVWDGNDKKQLITSGAIGTEEEIIQKTDKLATEILFAAQRLSGEFSGFVDSVDVHGDAEQFARTMNSTKRDWLHHMTTPAGAPPPENDFGVRIRQ